MGVATNYQSSELLITLRKCVYCSMQICVHTLRCNFVSKVKTVALNSVCRN